MSRNVPHASAHGLRNPWLEGGAQSRVYSDSSSGSLGPPAYSHLDTEHTSKEELARRHPLETGRVPPLPAESTGKYLLSKERGVPVPRHTTDRSEINTAGRSLVCVSTVAPSPAPSPTPPAIVPWGGHCVPLETFCHYFLQVVFFVGVLGGLALTVAGSVGWRDLSVLTYIGLMTCSVSGLLLSVQCCVRRRPRRRPHHHPFRPQTLHLHHHPSQQPPLIPLRTMPNPVAQPLLVSHQGQPEFREESGIPWWRREHS